jgi:NodT family efflux transporter outer membrane factor (OMF) lipoprotein
MYNKKILIYVGALSICLWLGSCKIPQLVQKEANTTMPIQYGSTQQDTTNTTNVQWRNFFTDKYLINLIDTALKNNQELNITLQDIEIAKNDIRLKNGMILPSVGLRGTIGAEKVGRYTSQGAGDASAEITPGREVPVVLTDFTGGAYASWEIDVWKKLRNAKKAAVTRYLSSVEGKNFVMTNLVAEVANAYYELLALDNQLAFVMQNIVLQNNVLEVIKVEKQAARATELAVQKFQAEVLKYQSLEFDILQNIKETENNINLLLGRYPVTIIREKRNFLDLPLATIQTGIPSQLLANRPDIKQAELELAASKIDLKVARAEFYPSFGISAVLGFQAFKPSYLVKLPESLLYSLAGDIAGPLINKNAIKAEFFSANARQLQAMYQYERTILAAYLEVNTQLSSISNLKKSYDLKLKQVNALTQSITISNDLFKSARADYMEVLLTQRDALEAKFELLETKKQQMNATVTIYRSLGGGWK